MINSIVITNHLDESVTLRLRFPEQSGFLIQSIDGLGPGKSNLNFSEISGNDGGLFNSARMGTRNIVFSFLFKEKQTIESARRLSYRYFPIKKPITMVFNTDERNCQISGYVESNEVNIFSKAEGAVISVICPDPYFYDLNETVTSFGNIGPQFEFPFSNESVSQPLLKMGEMVSETLQTILYSGDMEVGILIQIHAIGTAENITIYNADTLDSIFIDTAKIEAILGSPLAAGDDIFISSIKGNKYARIVRSGVTTNIINAIEISPSWFILAPGNNTFTYEADSGLANLLFSITNRIAYQGL